MQEYCEESVECRRRMFSRKFGETEKSREGGILVKQFTACGSMCDNCLLHKNRHHIMRSVDLGEQHDTSGVKNGKGVKRRLLPATQSTFSSKKTSAPPIPSLGFRSARTQLILEAKENEGNRNIDESWLSATVRR